VATLNCRILTRALLFLACTGAWLIPEPCQAQTAPQLPTLGTIYRVPYYQVQILYDYLGVEGNGWAEDYWWVVSETENYERALAIYEYYLLAEEQGILADVAPYPDYWWSGWEAVDVRMVTKYRYVYVRN